jgi:branched-chain amino acid transport system substrate-binding protein
MDLCATIVDEERPPRAASRGPPTAASDVKPIRFYRKQAARIVAGGQNLAGIVMFISGVHSLGLKQAQGLIITEAYYWDLNDKTRAFGKRFFDRRKRMPTMNQASTYSATLHYLKAAQAAGTKDTKPVLARMRQIPVRDAFTDNGVLRDDGRMVHSMFLFEVKKPEESKGPWDYYNVLAEVPGDQAFRPLKDGGCPLVK